MLDDATIRRDGVEWIGLRSLYKLRKVLSYTKRKKLNKRIRSSLKEYSDFTILCNNCLGGVFYHDAGRKFASPTINLAFDGEDFLNFLENPENYLDKDFDFMECEGVDYPVGQIDDVEIRFVHYTNNNECSETWQRRAKRIIWDNIYIIATDVDGLGRKDLLVRFDKLQYKNKIMFTSQDLPQYDWAVTVPQFKNRYQVRVMTQLANLKGERYYETCFDIPNWIKKCNASLCDIVQ